MRRVLLIDDSPEDREMIVQALRSDRETRHDITEAASAQEGLSLLHGDHAFDLIVLDYRLPDMEAPEFIQRFLGNDRVPKLPILVLTGSLEGGLPIQGAMRSGVQEFLSKSQVSPALLSRLTANAIERHKLVRRLDASEKAASSARQREEKARHAAEEARSAAERADRAKTQFLALISHELRTPLTAIVGFADILKDDPTNKDASHMLSMMADSGNHLAELLNDLIDMAKVEAGSIDVEPACFDPVALLKSTCALMSMRAAEKGLRLASNIDESLPDLVWSDPVRLRQIVINLLGNAIKFTSQGVVSIVARPSDTANQLEIRVADTGPGVPEDVRDTLFTPFVQGGKGGGSRREGIGLGLAISKRLAQLMGGDLLLESTSTEGTVFRLELSFPAATATGGPPPGFAPNEVVSNDGPPDLTGRRLLVAEDTRANQFLIRKLLEPTSAEVILVENGLDAVRAVSDGETPALVLMDMLMPRMDGYEAALELRKHRYFGPVVALTAATTASDHDRCRKSGCDEVLTKPIDTSEFYQTLRRLLNA